MCKSFLEDKTYKNQSFKSKTKKSKLSQKTFPYLSSASEGLIYFFGTFSSWCHFHYFFLFVKISLCLHISESHNINGRKRKRAGCEHRKGKHLYSAKSYMALGSFVFLNNTFNEFFFFKLMLGLIAKFHSVSSYLWNTHYYAKSPDGQLSNGDSGRPFLFQRSKRSRQESFHKQAFY